MIPAAWITVGRVERWQKREFSRQRGQRMKGAKEDSTWSANVFGVPKLGRDCWSLRGAEGREGEGRCRVGRSCARPCAPG